MIRARLWVLLIATALLPAAAAASVNASNPVIPLSGYGRSKFLSAINQLRARPQYASPVPPLALVQYNYAFEAGLVDFITTMGVDYFYHYGLGGLDALPAGAPLLQFKNAGWGTWFKDSCYAHGGGTGIGFNVMSRIQQGWSATLSIV